MWDAINNYMFRPSGGHHQVDNLKTKAPNTTGSNHLYNTLELLIMGIMLLETCWASNKICNKNHLLHLAKLYFMLLLATLNVWIVSLWTYVQMIFWFWATQYLTQIYEHKILNAVIFQCLSHTIPYNKLPFCILTPRFLNFLFNFLPFTYKQISQDTSSLISNHLSFFYLSIMCCMIANQTWCTASHKLPLNITSTVQSYGLWSHNLQSITPEFSTQITQLKSASKIYCPSIDGVIHRKHQIKLEHIVGNLITLILLH